MNKRIVLAIAGVAAVVAVVWITTRTRESAAVAEQAASAEAPVTMTPDSMPPAPAPLASAEAPAIAPPIDVSPGFEFLSKPAAEMQDTDGRWFQWRRHRQLQSELRDESWAPRIEAALRSGIQDALTAQGFDTQRIELPVVECRTTGCEIQALGYSGDSVKNGADLEFILSPLLGGNLRGEFDMDGSSMLRSSRPDQRVTIFLQLTRKKN